MNGIVLFAIAIGYAAVLFAVAWAARARRPGPRERRIVYTLGLAVYCSSWTFYGAVGSAVADGWAYLPIYLGPILVFALAPRLLARLVAAVQADGATSIADFIGARFSRSRGVAALVTLIALLGTIPYVALQLRSVGTTYAALAGMADATRPMIATSLVLAGFAIGFGTRVDGRGRADGALLAAVSVESLVKLAAFAAVALFAVLLVTNADSGVRAAGIARLRQGFAQPPAALDFAVVTMLAAAAVLCLPRQFHVSVIAAASPADPVRARWPFVGYLALFAVLVVPVTLAGLIAPAGVRPDLLVIGLPLMGGAPGLALLGFVGGFSAATGMVVVETVALATMVSNDLIAPLLLRHPRLGRSAQVGRVLLWVRRGVILGMMAVALGYALLTPAGQGLAASGIVAFAAMAQFAPALLLAVAHGGRDPKAAMAGLASGLAAWGLLLFVPVLIGHPIVVLPSVGGAGPLTMGALAALAINALVHWGVARSRAPRLAIVRDARVAPVRDLPELVRLVARFVGEERAASELGEGTHVDARAARRAERLVAQVVGVSSARRLVASALSGEGLDVAEVARMLDASGQSLQFSQGLLAATLEHIDPGVSVVDAALNLVAWNQRYIDLFGFPAGMIRVGAPVADAIAFNALRGDCGPGEVDDHVARRLAHMRRGRRHSFERVRSDGRVLKTVGGPMPGGGYVMCFSDITAEAQALRAVETARAELERRVTERTAALSEANAALARATADKTRFLAAASHDLLQPLHAARLFTAALARGADDRQQPLVTRIDQSIAAADQLLRALLDISRLDAGGIVPVATRFAVRELLAELVDSFADQARAKGLRLRLGAGDAVVETDRVLLRSIVQNLLGNAVRYTARGGVVIGVRRRGGLARIEVVDSGPGIPEDARGRVFREFERLATAEDAGLGLGLAIVARTATLLGAVVELDSRVGRGSRFAVSLAIGEGPVVTAPVRTVPQAVRPLRCLIVDDDAGVRRGMAALATSRGHGVRIAAGADEALAQVDGVAVAFVDHDLGGTIDGLTLIGQLRERVPGLRAALVTADASRTLAEAARDMGVAVLLKPLSGEVFDAWVAAPGKA
ncbi:MULTISPECIES: PAS domain-containing hybrid sensor histidine kinase/response regulator [unclassified Sphingomonas]|uniref:hybrid sensor histidine kinase/response regulator n=1 Tax=unclassified Sphingomonas TaxID=196159 RepID=UPI000B2C5C99|nr:MULTISPECIES: PAS domain-containing hybrid sensor histidine kinase/response regulator [unclassified Sphingomonas]